MIFFPKEAAYSLAIPNTDKQSGLFGVISNSIIGSLISSALVTVSPILFSDKTAIPSFEFLSTTDVSNPISSKLVNIPGLMIPLRSASFKTMSPGRVAPTCA